PGEDDDADQARGHADALRQVLAVAMLDALDGADDPAAHDLQHAEADAEEQERGEDLHPEDGDLEDAVTDLVVQRGVEERPADREAFEEVTEALTEDEAPDYAPRRAPV